MSCTTFTKDWSASSETGEIVPVLATSWSLSEDQLSWTFNLREGVMFHDGTDFNADVVKFNFDRVMDASNELGNVKQWEPHIASVEVVDAHTVKLEHEEALRKPSEPPCKRLRQAHEQSGRGGEARGQVRPGTLSAPDPSCSIPGRPARSWC